MRLGTPTDARTAAGSTRAALLRRALAVSGASLAAAAAVAPARGAQRPSRGRDTEILNFALMLEELQGRFYDEAARVQNLPRELRDFVGVVGDQEREHAQFLRSRLGTAARARSQFSFRPQRLATARAVATAALELEELVTAAYIGQGANLTPRGIRTLAPIVSVEARHAAWIRDIEGVVPAPRAADPAQAPRGVLDRLRRGGLGIRG